MNFDQIKEDLDLFSEWEDRYGYIIDLGKQISLPDEKKTEKNRKFLDTFKFNLLAKNTK